MTESIFALLGVIIGAALSSGWDAWKGRQQLKHAKRSLRAELEMNLALIPPKRHMLETARQQIALGHLTPTKTVLFSTVFYDRHLDTVYPELTALEAQSLHFIREHTRIIDVTMDNLLDMLKSDLERKTPTEVQSLYVGLTGDLVAAMDRLEDMLRQHLAGTPVRVIELTHESLKSSRA